MRLPRLLVPLVCATMLSGGSVALATTASASTAHYVALGDSYSSGDGAGNYSGGNCLRSANAYPQLWANAHAPASFDFEACSGAVVSDVLNGQLGNVNSGTSLISITIGGNDVGFSNVMETCVLGSDSSCATAVSNAESYANNTLPGTISNLFSTIRSKAPSAHVVVLDYPHLYKITSFCLGLDNTKRIDLNGGADVLDTTISKAAANAGFTFADVRGPSPATNCAPVTAG